MDFESEWDDRRDIFAAPTIDLCAPILRFCFSCSLESQISLIGHH